MPESPPIDSLVLYKRAPARVVAISDRVELQLAGGAGRRVRPKDLLLLHPGPVHSLVGLELTGGEWEEVWELLEGQTTTLAELAELTYGEFTPASAWSAWTRIADGMEYSGTPNAIVVRVRAEVEAERAQREARNRARTAWADFLERVRGAKIDPQDRTQLTEVEALALGRRESSRVLKALDLAERTSVAHELLIRVGYWTPEFNPYPPRAGLPESPSNIELPDLPQEDRLDLTGLPAFAIDDEGNADPDDALSIDGDRLWVHVADVAAMVPPDTPSDLEARMRGATQYLPERQVPMLPPSAVEVLGLGLGEISPALSFGVDVDRDGAIREVEIVPSWVRVERLSYAQADKLIEGDVLSALAGVASRRLARRRAAGAIEIRLPEIKIRVRDGEIEIHPVPALLSRALVAEAMLLAGEAAAWYAARHGVAVPHSTQAAADEVENLQGLAGMYALRRAMQPSQQRISPLPHAGLGLPAYAQATSPLRRYTDLLTHQQLRAHALGHAPLTEEQVLTRIAESESSRAAVRRAERGSNRHWTLIWLRQQKEWRGEGVVVEQGPRKATVLIPELALETRMAVRGAVLNEVLKLRLTGVDLPEL